MLLRLLPVNSVATSAGMEQVFIDQREEARAKEARWHLAPLVETAKGIFTTAPREHLSMLRQDSTFACA